MIQGICKLLFRWSAWKGNGFTITHNKCIFVGVPHTTAWDFIWVWIYYTSLGKKINFLIKKEFFFWPLGGLITKMGGIPIDRSKGANVIRQIITLYNEREHLLLAITPEGTRKKTKNWKAGFHTIATQANIPVYLGSFDWGRKELMIWEQFELSDDHRGDIKKIKDFYREKGVKGKFPDQFTTEY